MVQFIILSLISFLLFYFKIIKLSLNSDSLESIKFRIIKFIILKRAYKGYVWYNTSEDENAKYLTIEEFSNFEFWKIDLSFRMYLQKFKNIKVYGVFSYDHLTIRNLFFK